VGYQAWTSPESVFLPAFVAATSVEGFALLHPNPNPGSGNLDQGRGYEYRYKPTMFRQQPTKNHLDPFFVG
jgi:hypothetical protein